MENSNLQTDSANMWADKEMIRNGNDVRKEMRKMDSFIDFRVHFVENSKHTGL